MSKRAKGQYFTAGNPFDHVAFGQWAEAAGLPNAVVLEPYAGANNLIRCLREMNMCRHSQAFDIDPADAEVKMRDTLQDFPKGFDVCVTNPPWLAKNSATRRGLPFPSCRYDDLYKFALEKCLNNCDWVAALIPESFIRANLFEERLISFISITYKLFDDTDNPVGLAMFGPDRVDDTEVWSGKNRVGLLSELKEIRPIPSESGIRVRFNRKDGNVGLLALDNTVEPSIRFCRVEELKGYVVKHSSRGISKLAVDAPVRIDKWNKFLVDFREKTSDVLMTSFKGLRKDGKYRRRCDWALARGVIQHA